MHGAAEGEVHGGAFLVDLANQSVFHTIKYDFPNIEWFGEEGGRGLRGMALDGDTLYIAAGNRLLAYDTRFRPKGSWQNPYLANCQGISIHQRELFIACSGNDCIVAFDLDDKKFYWAMHVRAQHFQFRPLAFDPAGREGPLAVNKLQLRSVRCSEGGLYISGMKTGGLLHFNGSKIQMLAETPKGSQDTQVFRNGVVFNDSRAGVLRYSGDDEGTEDRALAVPYFEASDHGPHDPDELRMLKRGYARGLCVLSGTVVAGGSTPAGISLYNLKENRKLLTVRFTKNPREAINDIMLWPH